MIKIDEIMITMIMIFEFLYEDTPANIYLFKEAIETLVKGSKFIQS